MAEALSLAFVAFNAPGSADFVIEGPTPIAESGREVARVYHYSRLESMAASLGAYALAVTRGRAHLGIVELAWLASAVLGRLGPLLRDDAESATWTARARALQQRMEGGGPPRSGDGPERG